MPLPSSSSSGSQHKSLPPPPPLSAQLALESPSPSAFPFHALVLWATPFPSSRRKETLLQPTHSHASYYAYTPTSSSSTHGQSAKGEEKAGKGSE